MAIGSTDAYVDLKGDWHDENDIWNTWTSNMLFGKGKMPSNPEQAAPEEFMNQLLSFIKNDFEENLQLLTKGKDVNYNDYIAKIRGMAASNPKYMPAYIVKLADMHDHFAQVDTLTDKLKNKYAAAMPYLI